MNITIELTKLIGHSLTASQFMFCYLVDQSQYSLLNSLLTETNWIGVEADVKYLLDNGWITSNKITTIYDLVSYTTTPKYKSRFGVPVDLFDDVLSIFPDFVIRSGGHKDFLKTNLVKARLKYKKITNNNIELHNQIIACLKYELNMRQQENSLGFMKKILSWLESEEWKSYIDYINDTPATQPKIYGTELL